MANQTECVWLVKCVDSISRKSIFNETSKKTNFGFNQMLFELRNLSFGAKVAILLRTKIMKNWGK